VRKDASTSALALGAKTKTKDNTMSRQYTKLAGGLATKISLAITAGLLAVLIAVIAWRQA